MSESGLVSQASPVHTAVRNCTRDEGGPFEVGNHGLISSPLQAVAVKSLGGERCGARVVVTAKSGLTRSLPCQQGLLALQDAIDLNGRAAVRLD
jgi:hypothetical protein